MLMSTSSEMNALVDTLGHRVGPNGHSAPFTMAPRPSIINQSSWLMYLGLSLQNRSQHSSVGFQRQWRRGKNLRSSKTSSIENYFLFCRHSHRSGLNLNFLSSSAEIKALMRRGPSLDCFTSLYIDENWYHWIWESVQYATWKLDSNVAGPSVISNVRLNDLAAVT